MNETETRHSFISQLWSVLVGGLTRTGIYRMER